MTAMDGTPWLVHLRLALANDVGLACEGERNDRPNFAAGWPGAPRREATTDKARLARAKIARRLFHAVAPLLVFVLCSLGRSSPGFADERKEVHVSIRPHGIPPDIKKWAFRRGTKTRILDVEEGFDKVTEGLTVFVYDPKAPPENNCILKEVMDERHETEREDIHIPPEWRERCSGGGSGSPKGAGAGAAHALAQAGAVANLSSPEGEKGSSPYGIAGGMNPTAESSPGLQAAVATVQIALSASEMKQMVERATRFVVARLTKQAEIEAVEKATLNAIEQLGKEGKAVSREAIENRAREAAREAEKALRASGGGKAAGSGAANGVTTVHVPGPRKPPPLGASGTPIRTPAANGAEKATPRVSSRTLRNKWEAETGEAWPKDPKTGRNHDVAHKKPLSEGGSHEVGNYEPLPHDEHARQHSDAGDFKRWGSQGTKPKQKGPE